MNPLIFHTPSTDDRPADGESAAPRSAPAIAPTDGERLMRFRRHRDQAALAEVVEAHAAMVWGVCWQVLRHRQDVEDAFQATFMILARKASSIRANDSAAGWLYRVALRTALIVRQRRRRRPEQPLEQEPLSECQQLAAVEQCEQRSALLDELNSLPDRYQQPLVLCYLEGMSRREAAEQIGCTSAAIKGRLARGRRLLRARLVRRGVALSSAMSALSVQLASATAAVTQPLLVETTAAAHSFTQPAAASMKTAASSIAKEGILAMSLTAAAKPMLAVVAAGVVSLLLAAAVADDSGQPAVGTAASQVLKLAGESADQSTGSFGSAPVELTVRLDTSGASEPAADGAESAPIPQATIELVHDNPTNATSAFELAANENEVEATVELASDQEENAASDARPATTAAGHAEESQDVRVVESPLTPLANVGRVEVSSRPLEIRQEVDREQVLQQQTTAQWLPLSVESFPRTSAPASRKQLQLEAEYWQLKARGLERKSHAMMEAADRTMERHQAGQTSANELGDAQIAQADTMLLLAEVKLCQSKAAGIEQQLEQMDQPPAAHTPSPAAQPPGVNASVFVPPPTPATHQPIAPPQPAHAPQPNWPGLSAREPRDLARAGRPTLNMEAIEVEVDARRSARRSTLAHQQALDQQLQLLLLGMQDLQRQHGELLGQYEVLRSAIEQRAQPALRPDANASE